MSYFAWCFIAFIVGYVVVNFLLRFFMPRVVYLRVSDKKGQEKIVAVNAGKDKKFRELIKAVEARKKGAAH